jgi:hypothetical protein
VSSKLFYRKTLFGFTKDLSVKADSEALTDSEVEEKFATEVGQPCLFHFVINADFGTVEICCVANICKILSIFIGYQV